MSKPDPLRDFVLDQLSDMPGISTRAMFGGTSFYSRGRIFAIIAMGDLYIKETDANRDKLAEMDTPLFAYPRKDGTVATMKYRRVSADALEDRELLLEYARSVEG